jgi:hypothetical protein
MDEEYGESQPSVSSRAFPSRGAFSFPNSMSPALYSEIGFLVEITAMGFVWKDLLSGEGVQFVGARLCHCQPRLLHSADTRPPRLRAFQARL